MIAALELGAGRERTEDDVQLVFDASPPTLSVPATSITVPQGNELNFTVRASDDNLSGVARVEYEVDVNQLGEMKEPKPAGHLEGDVWTVFMPKVELPPGRHRFLVRAVDHVGRTSSLQSVFVLVQRPPAPVVAKSSITISLEPPATFADVTVNGAAKGRIKPGQTIELPDEAPGKYKIEA
jgi:hypothetical protein